MITDAGQIQTGTVCRRKDPRRFSESQQPLIADCITRSDSFKELVQNLSSKGVLLATRRNFSVGEEIAMTIAFPGSEITIRATGEVIRADMRGVAVEFKVVFNY